MSRGQLVHHDHRHCLSCWPLLPRSQCCPSSMPSRLAEPIDRRPSSHLLSVLWSRLLLSHGLHCSTALCSRSLFAFQCLPVHAMRRRHVCWRKSSNRMCGVSYRPIFTHWLRLLHSLSTRFAQLILLSFLSSVEQAHLVPRQVQRIVPCVPWAALPRPLQAQHAQPATRDKRVLWARRSP